MRGAVLFAGPPVMMAESLFDYLEPVEGTSGISRQRIAEVLSGIAINDAVYTGQGGISLNISAGAYALGNLAGCAAPRPAALFIGKQARENYRRQQIAAKEEEILRLTEEIAAEQAKEAALLQATEQLRQAHQDFPSHEAAQSTHDEIRRQKGNIAGQEKHLVSLEEKQKEFDLFADGSALADAADLIFDSKWIKEFIDAEAGRYLPGEGSVPLLPDGKNLPAAAPAELLTSKDDIYPLKDYNKESREYL
jgi:hypothetical protein